MTVIVLEIVTDSRNRQPDGRDNVPFVGVESIAPWRVLGHEVTVGGGGADVAVGVGVGAAGGATVGAGVGVGVGALAGVRLFVTLTVDEVWTVPPGVVATIASV